MMTMMMMMILITFTLNDQDYMISAKLFDE